MAIHRAVELLEMLCETRHLYLDSRLRTVFAVLAFKVNVRVKLLMQAGYEVSHTVLVVSQSLHLLSIATFPSWSRKSPAAVSEPGEAPYPLAKSDTREGDPGNADDLLRFRQALGFRRTSSTVARTDGGSGLHLVVGTGGSNRGPGRYINTAPGYSRPI